MRVLLLALLPFLAGACRARPATRPDATRGFVAGRLVTFNDNGAWCWFQDPRVLVDPASDTLLVGSVAAAEGPGGPARAGNVEITRYALATGRSETFVLHENLEVDDHVAPALFVRPDGRYLAMYAGHRSDDLSRWRVSVHPHDTTSWQPERTFDWSAHTGGSRVTYANLHYLPAEGRLYSFVRAVNDDPVILVSTDFGDTWAYGGKLLTEPKVGYVNGYTRYASNGTGRIDFVTTNHHPRDFDNSVFHGYIQNGRLHDSFGKVVDENVLDPEGRSQTGLTTILAAGSVWGGERMTHAWTSDLRLDAEGNAVAILTCRANDEPENSNFEDHRFFYARFDGRQWRTHQLARAGGRLWESEQDYTGLGAVHPLDPNRVVLSAPIDPRDGKRLAHHEIFEGRTADGGATWVWTPVTFDSEVDNLRPVIPAWKPGRTAILWFRGTMTRSQHYDTAVVGVILEN